MFKLSFNRIVFFALSLFININPANAREESNFLRMIAQADIVFYGIVKSVEYRNAEPEIHDERPMPYTFVTYQILELLSGTYHENEITLQFIGGLADAKTGELVTVSDQPLFDVGEEDILFVSNNIKHMCPLVQCARGRIRVIDANTYTDSGRALMKSRSGEIGPGEYVEHDVVMHHNMGGIPMSYHFSDDPNSREKNDVDADTTRIQFAPLTLQTLAQFIREHRVQSDEVLVINADASRPFRGIDFSPKPAPGIDR